MEVDDIEEVEHAPGAPIAAAVSDREKVPYKMKGQGQVGGGTRLAPWVEKYRPKNIGEVVSQEEVKAALGETLRTGNLPHLLFYGPAGTGKTSTILALCKELFGPAFRERVLELNASDERGIAVIRDRVKTFAQIAVSDHYFTSPGADGAAGVDKSYKVKCPPYKIVILDEADSMTDAAQSALRRMMETYSKNTRFCIICNYVSRIIDPITSRCAKFRFRTLDGDVALNFLQTISTNENLMFRDRETVLNLIVKLSNGDLRRMITSLQSLSMMRAGDVIETDMVYDVYGSIPPSRIDAFIQNMRNFDKLIELSHSFLLDGYSTSQLLHSFSSYPNLLNGYQKSLFSLVMAKAESFLILGADEHLQLLFVISALFKISSLH